MIDRDLAELYEVETKGYGFLRMGVIMIFQGKQI